MNFGGVQALLDVDFDLPQGQIRALIGPNGAGKSTFVGAVCGRFRPSAGRVYFEDQDISQLPAHRRIGLGMAYSFQITSIFGSLTVYENVALAVRRAVQAQAEEIVERVHMALDRVGLLDRVEQKAGDLSYGHQRLLEIAMGLGQEPRLFIMDEPTQGLAASEITAFIELLRGLAGESTILLIEHNMHVVMECADTLTVLNFGQILAEGVPSEIRADSRVQHAYFGSSIDA